MSDSTPYSVPKDPGRWRAIFLAAAVHAALVAFLWIGIRWQNETPVSVDAEVWNLTPQEAAPVPRVVPPPSPPAPTPTPVPKEEPKPVVKAPPPQVVTPPVVTPPVVNPEIAIEREKKRKQEIARQHELERQEQLAEDRREKLQAEKLREKKLEQRREQQADARAAEAKAAEEKRRDEQRKKQLVEEQHKKQLADEQHKKQLADEQRKKQIADEQRKRQLAEQQQKKQAAAEEKAADDRRNQDLSRLQHQANAGSGGSGTAARSQGARADPSYVQRVGAKIKSNTAYNVPDDLSNNSPVEYSVELLPDGSVRGVAKQKSSGVPGFDEAVARAIQKSAPFPPDKTGSVPSGFTLVHRPKDSRP
ncbi:MAG: tolA [Herminiimonas sp.]|nr:tolA [Herminiimonas sp.]MDB5855108.1 tolA [Herminiimonas sp.]